jgi:hypothetical protein
VLACRLAALRKALSITRAMPGITLLLIASQMAPSTFGFFRKSYFLHPFFPLIIGLLLAVAFLFFEPACYYLLTRNTIPLRKNLTFLAAVKKYFWPLILIEFYVFLLTLPLVVVSVACALRAFPGQFRTAWVALNISVVPINLLTMYAVPALYVRDLRGFKAVRHGFAFLNRHWQESASLITIVLLMGGASVASLFILPAHWQRDLEYFSLMSLQSFVFYYVDVLVFLSAVEVMSCHQTAERLEMTGG